ncbi:DUF1643 domain-containing protein [Thermoplasma sp. Kam2015]|uniref:DUF1643 domain-containing protein n=1 Tax=Thermoplasma sp. Kam2015 TaxID=2094122 RepID=UPI001F1A4236|nr:DUF1643 domain-containing protein [Thermoplasma sp. Kam2015]
MTAMKTMVLDVGFPQASGAEFSPDGRYRYTLWRIWDPKKPVVLFLLLNPSTADEFRLDPTLTRCRNYAKKWGYGGMLVGNIFALRSTDPRDLYRAEDPVGPENDRKILEMIGKAETTVVGWGSHGKLMGRGEAVLRMVPHPFALGLNSDGTPKHPLYLPGSAVPKEIGASAEHA